MSGKFTYTEVFHQMSPLEIDKANLALDIQNEAEQKAINKAKKGK